MHVVQCIQPCWEGHQMGIFDPDDFLWAVTVPESTPYYHIPINLNPASPHLIHSSCYVGLYCWFIYNFRWSPTGLNILNIPGPPSHIPSSLNKHSTFSFLFTSWLKGSACSSPQTWRWINAFSCSLQVIFLLLSDFLLFRKVPAVVCGLFLFPGLKFLQVPLRSQGALFS